jgi:hypothetical protein
MKWICSCAAVYLLCTATTLWGETLAPTGAYAGPPGDPWNDSVIPSGLRFTEPTTTVKTGSYGGGAYGGLGPCGGCGAGGTCVHWTMLPWYAPWPTVHDAYRYERRSGSCYGTPGYY